MNNATNKKRCKAMEEAGVTDPDNSDGIDFCVNHCPYEYCVAFEEKAVTGKSNRMQQKEQRAEFAKALHAHSVSVVDIALILRVSERTVDRYFK